MNMDEILEAFKDILDGVSWEDLQRFTGLPTDRCIQILALWVLACNHEEER